MKLAIGLTVTSTGVKITPTAPNSIAVIAGTPHMIFNIGEISENSPKITTVAGNVKSMAMIVRPKSATMKTKSSTKI